MNADRGAAVDLASSLDYPWSVPPLTARELLAHNLARLIEASGLSEAEVGGLLGLGSSPGVAAANLRRYGITRWPSPERLDELAEALGCRPADFFADPS